MKKYLMLIVFVSCSLAVFSQSSAVPFTLEDRDRIIRTEQEIKSLRNEMNTRFESLNSKFESIDTKFESLNIKFESIDTKFESQQLQINNLKDSIGDIKVLLLWGFGIMFSLFLFMLGYMIWDRRTALNPVRIKTETISNILRDFAKENVKFAEILRSYGL